MKGRDPRTADINSLTVWPSIAENRLLKDSVRKESVRNCESDTILVRQAMLCSVKRSEHSLVVLMHPDSIQTECNRMIDPYDVAFCSCSQSDGQGGQIARVLFSD